MYVTDIALALMVQIVEDYGHDSRHAFYTCFPVENVVPTFRVCVCGEWRVYRLIKLGDHELFMSCSEDEYESELKEHVN